MVVNLLEKFIMSDNSRALELYLQEGLDPDFELNGGKALIEQAYCQNSHEVVNLLLEHGAVPKHLQTELSEQNTLQNLNVHLYLNPAIMDLD
jgi:ankyrin repeat protein